VVAVALLSLEFASVVVALTEAVFEVVVPAGPFAVATSVTVKDAPLASEVSETVRLFPLPPQTAPPVALQDTKVTSDGRLSVT